MASRINSPQVIHQVFETEVVVVNLETGKYYSVTGCGIDIWKQLDGGASSESVIQSLPGVAKREIDDFLRALEQEQLILPGGGDGKTTGAAEPSRSTIPPKLETFTDMRELLLVDPIHELDEAGWPKPPPANGEK